MLNIDEYSRYFLSLVSKKSPSRVLSENFKCLVLPDFAVMCNLNCRGAVTALQCNTTVVIQIPGL